MPVTINAKNIILYQRKLCNKISESKNKSREEKTKWYRLLLKGVGARFLLHEII